MTRNRNREELQDKDETVLQCVKPKSRTLIQLLWDQWRNFHYPSHSDKGEEDTEPGRQLVIKNAKNRKTSMHFGWCNSAHKIFLTDKIYLCSYSYECLKIQYPWTLYTVKWFKRLCKLLSKILHHTEGGRNETKWFYKSLVC